ncbi:hypothetical protein OBBRIDRAFT_791967 [Obba rivulosa]|uniref:Uncharacterized protein n=1 Tax=Obba rivulosa TaxID=1052685 RepID=A0A8E2B0M6_9APHY|nr:hypothetical protein OBBRIDRAFT_791967 [Obba rivulosa]
MSSNTNTTGTTGGSSAGQKLRGATEVVHGIGENIRGRMMEVIDDVTGTNRGHAETQRGTMETEQGMSRMTGHTYSNATGAGAGDTMPANAAHGGTGGTMQQGPYQGNYTNQGDQSTVPTGGPAAPAQGGRNNAELQSGYAGEPQAQAPPRDRSADPGPDYTNNEPGTGVHCGGPRGLP